MPQVSLLTYNIFLRPPVISNNGDDLKNERLHLFVEHEMPKFDVVALQEMFSLFNTRLDTLIECSKKHGFKYFVLSTLQSDRIAISGDVSRSSPLVSAQSLKVHCSAKQPSQPPLQHTHNHSHEDVKA